MRALVIAPQPFFSPRGTPFSVYYRTLVTSELGVKVDLLTYGEGHDVDIPGVRIIRIPRFKYFGNVKVGPSFLKLFLDVFLIVWTVVLLMRNRYDYVHAHEESVFFCSFLKVFFRYKLIYDMHSSLPQQLTNFHFTRFRILIGLFKKLEDFALRSADVVISICPDLSDYVQQVIEDSQKHIMIENSIFDPVKISAESCKSGNPGFQDAGKTDDSIIEFSDNKRFIVYAGTLEPYQGIDILIKAFAKVIIAQPDAFLIIVGGDKDQVTFYRNLARNHHLNGHVFLSGRVPQQIAQQYIRLAAVLVSPRSEGTNTPLKIYEQLASGIPLVATNIYSHTQVLNNSVAFLVQPNPGAMAAGLISALQANGDGRHKVENAKRLYDEKYARPVYEKKMRHVLNLLN
jgi:glycosyltransferase involved in cell wall biosynthesis